MIHTWETLAYEDLFEIGQAPRFVRRRAAAAPYQYSKQVLKCTTVPGRDSADNDRVERRGEDRNFYDGAKSLGRTLLVVSLDQMSPHRPLFEGGPRKPVAASYFETIQEFNKVVCESYKST